MFPWASYKQKLPFCKTYLRAFEIVNHLATDQLWNCIRKCVLYWLNGILTKVVIALQWMVLRNNRFKILVINKLHAQNHSTSFCCACQYQNRKYLVLNLFQFWYFAVKVVAYLLPIATTYYLHQQICHTLFQVVKYLNLVLWKFHFC